MSKRRNDLSPTFLAQALASAANAAFITDLDGRIVWVNQAFCDLSGYSPGEAIGRTPNLLRSGRQDADFYRELWRTILAGNAWNGEVVERRKDGRYLTVDEVITPLRDGAGHVTHHLAIQHDVTRRRRKSEREHFLAYHDALTALPNRAMFLDTLQRTLATAGTGTGKFAVLYMDIDEFKSINDTLGHLAGDQLLCAVASRLRAAVREGDLIARFGGDEFCILLTELPDSDTAGTSARKIVNRLSQPFVLRGQTTVRSSVSVGIALYPIDGTQAEELLRHADYAMYWAKKRGRNRYHFFSRSTHKRPARGAKQSRGY